MVFQQNPRWICLWGFLFTHLPILSAQAMTSRGILPESLSIALNPVPDAACYARVVAWCGTKISYPFIVRSPR